MVGPLAAGLLSAGLAGCANGDAETIRSLTYPPHFNYIPPEKLKSTMWQLAAEIRQLEQVLAVAERGDAVPRETIAALLDRMQRSAAALGPGNVPSNHPRIADNVDRLRDDIRRARRGVDFDPPNYFWAGQLSGACRYCHAPVQ